MRFCSWYIIVLLTICISSYNHLCSSYRQCQRKTTAGIYQNIILQSSAEDTDFIGRIAREKVSIQSDSKQQKQSFTPSNFEVEFVKNL